MSELTVFERRSAVGRITIEPFDVDQHAETLHAWVTQPRARYWGMQDATVDEVCRAYAAVVADPHHDAWWGRVDGVSAFLVETYDPAHAPELADLPDLRRGDIGMHVLVGPPERPVRGFTTAVFRTVMELCLDDPRHERVVVEPDVRNTAIARLNAAAGFRVLREVQLPDKRAALSACTRADFEASRPVAGSVQHLTPDAMERAQRRLVAKAVAELAHERLVEPVPDGVDHVLVAGRAVYRFHAHRYDLEHWVVSEPSLRCEVDGLPVPIDAMRLVTDLAPELGIPDDLLPVYLEEISSTLAAAAWKDVHQRRTSPELLNADFQDVEAAMTEGHPAFIANNGRIGFSADDHAAYAPETGADVDLVWIAVRRDLSILSLGEGLDAASLYDAQLDAAVRARFGRVLTDLGLDPADYWVMPVHPWQWRHKIAVTFAPDVARRDLVHLGSAGDRWRAQQSIRTFLDTDRPDRHYVKTALSVQNMGFMRGLSPRYMRATPAINDWVHDLVVADPELQSTRFGVLRERAAIGYTGDAYHRLDGTSAYQKMVAALWRESPVPQLEAGERLATMASLLHRDREGRHLATEMVRASGLDPAAWVRQYLDAYLRPVAHCLLAHDLAFMPHGENVILVLRDHVPTRVFIKDIGEEVAVLGDGPLPAEVERIRAGVPEGHAALSVLTDVFDGFLRFLAALLAEDQVLAADDFWAEVAGCLLDHRRDHPELAEAFERVDLFAPRFAHSCLNRLQLRNTRSMVDLSDQASSLQFAGTLVNPVARFGP